MGEASDSIFNQLNNSGLERTHMGETHALVEPESVLVELWNAGHGVVPTAMGKAGQIAQL